MADPADRPTSITSTPESVPAGFAGRVDAGDRPAEPLVYRPLSLWAVVSFAVGTLYALVFSLMFVVSAWKGTPLQLGAWSLFFPIVGGVCALLAWAHIQRSEGTRAGASLAKWGGFLSLLSGIIYVAYGAAIHFAIAGEAQKFTDRWLESLKQGDVETAFYFTLDPSQRLGDDPKNIERMEARYNTTETGRTGSLGLFRQHEVVRILRQGGKDATFTSRGVRSVDSEMGGYKVSQLYEVSTLAGTWEFRLTVHGKESPHKEWEKREWSILWQDSGVISGKPKPLGNAVLNLHMQAIRFATQWQRKLGEDRLEEACLETREPQERERLRQQYQSAFLRPWLDPEAARRIYLPGYKEFLEGNVVRADQFWAPDQLKTELPVEIKKLFRRPHALSQAMTMDMPADRMRMPMWEVQDGRFRIELDYAFNVASKYAAEARLVLETDAKALESEAATPEWQVHSLQLYRGRLSAPMAPGAPPMPGRPRLPGM